MWGRPKERHRVRELLHHARMPLLRRKTLPRGYLRMPLLDVRPPIAGHGYGTSAHCTTLYYYITITWLFCMGNGGNIQKWWLYGTHCRLLVI